MALVKPTSYKVVRDVVINGVTYAKNDPVTLAVIAKFPHLSALLSRRYIQPVPDPHQRKGPWKHQPTHLGPRFLGGIVLLRTASPESPTPEVSGDAPSDYPENGTIPDVKAWVGDDITRAQYAIDQEEAKASPRVTLLDYLIDMTEA